MGFLKPKMPAPPPPPMAPANPAIAAQSMASPTDNLARSAGSLIATTARGLRRRATTERTSLIGGA